MASDYKFLTEPDDSLKCMICLEIAKDPRQHEDCGKLFCRECIRNHGHAKACPNCRCKSPQYFKDRRSSQEIKALHVRCDNVERGCDWEGTVETLDGHVTKCIFTLVSCPKECTAGGEDLKMMRKDLDDHLKTQCPNRDYECEHCGRQGTYASITEEHDQVCAKKIVPCTNSSCTLTMERGKKRKHVEAFCDYSIIACKYESIGCSEKKMRKDMKLHEEEDDKVHLHLSLEKTTELNSIVLSKSKKQSITFKLPEYSKKKIGDEYFSSDWFFTNSNGYKMCIEVYANGCGNGEDTHVSVCAILLEGPAHEILSWPFVGSVTVELLNQLADENHHSLVIHYNESSTSGQVGGRRGYQKFFSHSALIHDPVKKIQYLVKDTLYFRVTVEVPNHKPWLDCTSHAM